MKIIDRLKQRLEKKKSYDFFSGVSIDIETELESDVLQCARSYLDKDSIKFFEFLAQKLILKAPVVQPWNDNPHFWAYREGQNDMIRVLLSLKGKL